MDKRHLDSLIAVMRETGDEDAFAEFYRLTSPGLFAFLLAVLKEEAAAEDIMQDTYIRFRNGLSGYRIGTNPTAFLIQIGKRLAFNELKKRKRELQVDFADWNAPSRAPDPSEIADTSALDAVKRHLSADEAQIVMLHAVAGFKHREIAAIMKKPAGTVMWSYNNALKKLRKVLQEQESEDEK